MSRDSHGTLNRDAPFPCFTLSRPPPAWHDANRPLVCEVREYLACARTEVDAMAILAALLLQGERAVQVHRQGRYSRELVMELGLRGLD